VQADDDAAVALEHVLTGGEDHVLVATLPPGTPAPDGCRVVGRISAGEPAVLVDGEPAQGGWEHFA
jgi:thiamine-monophosphate kinase